MKAFLEQLDARYGGLEAWLAANGFSAGRARPAPRQAQAGVTAWYAACLIDVYDTILSSHFVPRMESLIEPLGIADRRLARRVGQDARGPGPRQGDHRRLVRADAARPRHRARARPGRRPVAARRWSTPATYARLCDGHGAVPRLAQVARRADRPGVQLRGHHARRSSTTWGSSRWSTRWCCPARSAR